MINLLPSGKIGRFVAVMWILACVSVVVHTILFRNASPYNFGDAQVVEWACMSMLSFPSSWLFYSTYAEVLFNWLGYPGNDPRTILFLWSIPFIAGYIQWFVLVPMVVRWARRKFGNKGANDVRDKTAMLKLFPSGIIGRVVAVLWTVTCVWLFVHTILLRNAPSHAFGDAEEVMGLGMVNLAFPSSMLVLWMDRVITFGWCSWCIWPENDPRFIFLEWTPFFVLGYIQWFVLVPFVARLVSRNYGSKDAGRSS